ncbi:MAG: hypothetical protein GWO19_02570, partial [Nitrospinaceae bacterium]|nr:hypothetical protein [Nitrospinaceae bacterium]
MKEQAEVEVELRLIAHHTEKLIAQKRFRAESAQGEVLFEVGPPPLDLNQPGLQDSSMGR